MSYLDGYMRGTPDLIGLHQFVQQGYQDGKARAQNERLAQLSQAAFNDTDAQQSQDVSQAIGIDPKYGYALAQQVGAQSATQQKKAQVQQLGKLASAIVAAKQSGNEAMAEGLYQAGMPLLQSFAAQHGAQPPAPTLSGSDMGGLYKLAVMYGQTPQTAQTAQLQTFNALSAGLSPADREKAKRVALGLDPRQSSAAIQYKMVLGADGRTRLVAVDPREVGATVVGGSPQGAQNGMGMAATVPGTGAGATPQAPQGVQFAFAPGTPQSVIDATRGAAGAIDGQPGALTSPTEAQSAYNVEQAKQAAQTQAEQARIPIEASGEAAKVTAKGQAQNRLDAPLARQKVASVSDGYDRMIDSVDQILSSPGLERAVGFGSYIPGIRGGSKVDADALITKLKSQVGFNVLQNMRDMSKTGGALGQISDKEEELLQNNLAALSTAQSPEQFRKQLLSIKQFAEESKRHFESAYNAQYGQPTPQAQTSGWSIEEVH
jgi:hypothetical protein